MDTAQWIRHRLHVISSSNVYATPTNLKDPHSQQYYHALMLTAHQNPHKLDVHEMVNGNSQTTVILESPRYHGPPRHFVKARTKIQ